MKKIVVLAVGVLLCVIGIAGVVVIAREVEAAYLFGLLTGCGLLITLKSGLEIIRSPDQTIDEMRYEVLNYDFMKKPKPRFYQFTWMKCLWIGLGFSVVGLFSLILEPLVLIGSFWNYCLSVASFFLPIGLFIVVVLTIERPRMGKKEKKEKNK